MPSLIGLAALGIIFAMVGYEAALAIWEDREIMRRYSEAEARRNARETDNQ